MNFSYEDISQDDYVKYQFSKIDNYYSVGGVWSKKWLIEESRNIFVRLVAKGREEFQDFSDWDIYYHGNRIIVEVKILIREKICQVEVKINRILEGEKIPSESLRTILENSFPHSPYLISEIGYVPNSFQIIIK